MQLQKRKYSSRPVPAIVYVLFIMPQSLAFLVTLVVVVAIVFRLLTGAL